MLILLVNMLGEAILLVKILFIGFIYIILISICFISPLLVRVAVFLLNCILPDPIPYVDEFLMGAGIVTKIISFYTHPILFILKYLILAIGIISVLMLVYK